MMIYAAGIFIVLSLVLIVYAFWPKTTEGEDAIKRRMSGRAGKGDAERAGAGGQESVTKRVMQRVVPIAIKPAGLSNPQEMSKLRMKLAAAGLRSDSAPATFLASKTVVALFLGLVGVLYAWAQGDTLQGAAGITLLGAGVGFMMPNLWLSMAVSKRQEKVREGLPDSLDMLVISVESGLGLDAALQRVGEEMHLVHPALSEELQLVSLESQMGVPRSEALVNLSDRTGLDEVRSLIAIINQAERFGTSIAKALRNQSDALRTKRRQQAEERAQKTTVKLMAPLILFIFPAILVVMAGPAALKMIEVFHETGLGQ